MRLKVSGRTRSRIDRQNLKDRLRGVAACVAIGALFNAVDIDASEQAQRRSTPYQLVSVRVQLFLTDRGTFSENIAGRNDLALRNVVIGAGDTGGASNATLVIAEVSGTAASFEASRKVLLTVRAGKRLVLRRAQSVPVLNSQGRGYLGFWVYDTGCEPLKIIAEITGQVGVSRKSVEVPFVCGE
jgi:hypothetical protein